MSSLPGIGGHKVNRFSLSPSDRRGKTLTATYSNAGVHAEKNTGAPSSARVPPSLQYLHAAQNTLRASSGDEEHQSARDGDHDRTFLTAAPVADSTTRVSERAREHGCEENGASYSLGPSESRVAAMKEETAERWRSRLLKYETELRELVATGSSSPPSMDDVMETLRIFDGIARVADGESPHLAEMLRLLRVQICRSVFSGYQLDFTREEGPVGDLTRSGDGLTYHVPNDEALVTYFDQVTSLLRENAGLQAEIALGNTRERLVQLTQQVETLSETLRMYEHEIGRLTRQNQHSMEDCRKVRQDFQEYKNAAETQQMEMGKEIQALNVENKDMQLQIFRLRKQIGGGRSKLLKDTYTQMKLSKMSTMASLFDEGDERVGILIFLSQLESRVNELLDTFDAEYLLTAENAKAAVQKQFAQMVAVLLEEEHLCRVQYRRLVPDEGVRTAEEDGDETDGFVALLFDDKIYENFVSREAIRQRLEAGAQRLRDEEQLQLNGGKPRDSDMDLRAGFAFAQPVHAVRGDGKASAVNDTASAFAAPTGAADTFLHNSRMSLVSHVMPLPTSATAAVASPLLPPFQQMAIPAAPGSPRAGDGGAGKPVKTAGPVGVLGGRVTTDTAATGTLADASFEEVVRARKHAWVTNIFGASATDALVSKYVNGVQVVRSTQSSSHEDGGAEAAINANTLMQRVLRRPLEDLSSGKFLSAFDIYAGRDPAQQKLLCSVNFVSPATPIQLPELTNFVKVKYKSSIDAEHAQEQGDTRTSTSAPSADFLAAPGAASSFVKRTTTTQHRGLAVASRTGASTQPTMLQQIGQWGGTTPFVRATETTMNAQEKDLFQANENLRVFHELGAVTKTTATLGGAVAARAHKAGAVSSTTALTVAFQRLNPLSPNRGPEWGVYKDLFGGYRTLTPRLLEVSTVDHILLRACERHYQRMSYRYDTCLMEANQRSTNSQMALTTAERFFRESYVLTDFQESIVDELESRYGYPELVAKNLYEILCYLDATAEKDGMFALYLDVVRGFKSPTSIHFTLYMLYQMSYGWPTSNPLAEVSREEVSTVLQYMYRDSGNVVRVDVTELLNEYDMATRSAPITFMTMRAYLSQVMLHSEEPLLLYFNGLFNRSTSDDASNGVDFEAFMDIITKYWQPKSERAVLVRFLTTSLGFNRDSLLTAADCANLSLSSWCSGLW